MRLRLSRDQRDRMIAHAQQALPNEGCGLLAGSIQGDVKTVREVYCLRNADESPEHFSFAPADQFAAARDMREKGLVLLGNFHSHPATPSRPSDEDKRLAFDPSLSYVIISLKEDEPVLKSFRITREGAAEEPVEI